uniref:Uncharacterized protein n=1 Tax=Anopheles coluzzii TaxID=1518534 RepID=A0A8W7PZE7_ANOCL
MIFSSCGSSPSRGATISFTSFMSMCGSRSTASVLPVLVFTYTLSELESFFLPKENIANMLPISCLINPNKSNITAGLKACTRSTQSWQKYKPYPGSPQMVGSRRLYLVNDRFKPGEK